MVVDAILQPSISFSVRTWLALDHDGTAIRQNEPVPDQQNTALTETDAVVVLTDQACALRSE